VEAKRFGSEPKRETISEKSPWGVTESVGDSRVHERASGGRERWCSPGPVGKRVRSTVRWNISGGRWYGGVEGGWLG